MPAELALARTRGGLREWAEASDARELKRFRGSRYANMRRDILVGSGDWLTIVLALWTDSGLANELWRHKLGYGHRYQRPLALGSPVGKCEQKKVTGRVLRTCARPTSERTNLHSILDLILAMALRFIPAFLESPERASSTS
jgi:hypothetical protein